MFQFLPILLKLVHSLHIRSISYSVSIHKFLSSFFLVSICSQLLRLYYFQFLPRFLVHSFPDYFFSTSSVRIFFPSSFLLFHSKILPYTIFLFLYSTFPALSLFPCFLTFLSFFLE